MMSPWTVIIPNVDLNAPEPAESEMRPCRMCKGNRGVQEQLTEQQLHILATVVCQERRGAVDS